MVCPISEQNCEKVCDTCQAMLESEDTYQSKEITHV